MDKLPPKLGYRVTTEVKRGEDPRGLKIKATGEELRPEGFDYKGSICIHLYKSPFNSSVTIATLNLLQQDVKALEANWALQQGSLAVAKDYGHEPPAIREDALKKEE